MSQLTEFSVMAGVLAAVLANIAIWSPRRLWIKLAALAAAAFFLPVAYGGMSDLLGRPKPIALKWPSGANPVAEATVLAARMREGEAIFLWLGFEGLDEPRSYVLPWSEEMARQLHSARRQAEDSGAELRMRRPFETSWDPEEPKFYALPQRAPPPKADLSGDPMWFEKPEANPDG